MQEIGGATVDDHMASVARQLGKAVVVANKPKLPDQGAYIWEDWLDLHRARSGSGFGPNPLSFQEIVAWATATGNRVNPWEVEAIRAIDDVFMDAMSKQAAKG